MIIYTIIKISNPNTDNVKFEIMGLYDDKEFADVMLNEFIKENAYWGNTNKELLRNLFYIETKQITHKPY